MKDFHPRCHCASCNAITPHPYNACRRRGKWFVEIHRVDNCQGDEPTISGIVCQQCFDSCVEAALQTIAWGMQGVRRPLCQGCDEPLTRLSSIFVDVGKV